MRKTDKIANWTEDNVDLWGGWIIGAALGAYLFWVSQWNSYLYSML